MIDVIGSDPALTRDSAINMRGIDAFDTYGAWLLERLARSHEARGQDLRIIDLAERYQGLLMRTPDGSDNYAPEANQNFAKNLKGKLLLAHGTTDNNVPPYNTLLVVNELIRANKDFDLLMLPNRTHGFGNEPYMIRRRWDYFVKNLLGAEPPKEYQIGGNR